MAEQTIKHSYVERLRINRFQPKVTQVKDGTIKFVKRNPVLAFAALILLFLVILSLGKALQPKVEEKAEPQIVRSVQVYSIGKGPQATFQGIVEKTGVVEIVAQTNGVVQHINKKEGDTISMGQQVISLSTNYQGGNASSVQRQIAQTQYQNVIDTYSTQKDAINNQREIADQTQENSDRLRDIQSESLRDTETLIDNNQSQITYLDDTLRELEASNQNGENDQQMQTIRGQITQLQGALNQIESQQRTTEYQTADDSPPARLADLQKQVTKKQLDIQEKSLELNKEVSRLQVQLAYVNEALMYPASPFTGTVEKIFVKKGQVVTPGTLIATIVANDVHTTVSVLVPSSVATSLQQGEPSSIALKKQTITATPYYVSTEATDGQLFSVYYDIPTEYQKNVSDDQYLSVTIPLGVTDSDAIEPLIPIDAVYQSQTTTSVLVAEGDKAVTRDITIGEVFGDYVAVSDGLKTGDQIILNRNVIAGETISVK